MDFLLDLFGWSLKQMLLGVFPSNRHDGSPLQEASRQRNAGKPLGFKGLLVEVKGDWEFYGNVLHLPRWDNIEGICFLCRATKEHLPQCDLEACWRQPEMRCNHQELVERLLACKPSLSPIWQHPFFHQRCLRLDWLHLADLGVTAALAGSILCLFVDPPGFPNFGPTIEDRRLTLWHMLLDFYKRSGLQTDRLKCLPITRFRHKKSPPFLKAQAATVRKMVPFLVQLMGFLDASNEEHRNVMAATMALGECYKCLSHTCQQPADYLKQQAAIFGRHVAILHGMKA